MNTKIIAGLTVLGVTTLGISSAFANSSENSSQNPLPRGGKMMKHLSEEEKTKIASMTETQKQEFFAQKKAEKQAKEVVIDKLLAGQTLTAEEENLRKQIIAERQAHKEAQTARQAKMEQIKTIQAKQTAGTTLTAEEQTLLNEFSEKKNNRGPRGNTQNNTTTAQ